MVKMFYTSSQIIIIYLLSVKSRARTLIGYTHTEAADATELVIWCNVERVILTLVT